MVVSPSLIGSPSASYRWSITGHHGAAGEAEDVVFNLFVGLILFLGRERAC
jgi:hypothetical protein